MFDTRRGPEIHQSHWGFKLKNPLEQEKHLSVQTHAFLQTEGLWLEPVTRWPP